MNADRVKRRLTKQKSAILEYLKSTKIHPDAETVYMQLRPKNPNISLSTVYRNLSQMSEDGLILRLTPGIKADHFDGDISPHHHFICNNCGRILDVMCEIDLKNENLGKVTSYYVYFYGICKECEKGKKLN